MARILVVDDNEQVAESFREILVEAGFVVETANNATNAILQEVEFHPDLVLMDLLLGDGNITGLVAALALRGLGYVGKIIVVTGGMDTTNQIIREQAPIDAYLLKPVTGTELLDEIKRQLEKNGHEQDQSSDH